ncbi:MAG TPA: ArsR family transcriptional regulator [Elusimicrobia bacterium]|jgi:ArsR family transcriptional regulator|nr:ArsR family transcriptional regulator [Elusimicrobiota bacterium]
MEVTANIFKALSEIIRLRIMRLLIKAKKELCVCEIVDALDETQYNVSRHLNILKNVGLVSDRRAGTWILYSLSSKNVRFNQKLIETIESIPSDKEDDDMVRLRKRLKMRVKGRCVIGYKGKGG